MPDMLSQLNVMICYFLSRVEGDLIERICLTTASDAKYQRMVQQMKADEVRCFFILVRMMLFWLKAVDRSSHQQTDCSGSY